MGKTSIQSLALAAAAWALAAAPAAAYPTSVIFTPTGAVAGLGEGNIAFYNAYYGQYTSTWAGFQVGVVPELPYGASGLVFPGLEVGFDVIGQHPEVRPILNAKLGLVREANWIPDLAFGLMSWSFLAPAVSLNMAYGAASKTLAVGDRQLGRVTLGLGVAFPGGPDVYGPTFPLPGNNSLLLGYELPPVGPFTFAFDSVGGDSEVSGTNAVVNVELVPGTFASIGYSFGHDRKAAQADAFFFQTYTNFDLAKAFGPPGAEAEEPETGMKTP